MRTVDQEGIYTLTAAYTAELASQRPYTVAYPVEHNITGSLAVDLANLAESINIHRYGVHRRIPFAAVEHLHITEKIVEVEQSSEAVSNLFIGECDTVGIYKNGAICRTKVDTPFSFVDREAFDFELIKKYKSLGGTLIEGAECAEADFEHKKIHLSNGDTVSCSYLIAADGANSRLRNSLGLKLRKIGFCIETRIPVPAGAEQEIGIYFDAVPDGYGWVFPSGERLCVGLGGVFDKKIGYKALLDSFLNRLGYPADGAGYRGAFVPYGGVTDIERAPDDVLFVGDAAGLVDPIYGEGLFYALSSGIEAGRAIASGEPKAAYLKAVAPYIDEIRAADKLQRRYLNKAGLAVIAKLMRNRPDFLRYYCEHMISRYDYSYKDLPRLALDYKKSKQP